jgi:hypothetical protein
MAATMPLEVVSRRMQVIAASMKSAAQSALCIMQESSSGDQHQQLYQWQL